MSEHENRIVTTLAPAEYHGMERLSSGGIKQLLRSPAHFRAWKDTPLTPTPAMQFGTVVHTLVLEPDRVDERVMVMPADAPDRRSNAGKDWHADFQGRATGKLIIGAADFDRARNAASAVVASPGWGIMREGRIETSLLWRDMDSSVLCKARPDYFTTDGAICVDLKTTIDASRENFSRQLWNLRYDVQAAFYMEGLYVASGGVMPHSFVWAAVETEPPHGVAWYRIGWNALEIARADIGNAIASYAKCTRDGVWPGYAVEIQEINLPAWARAKRVDNTQEF